MDLHAEFSSLVLLSLNTFRNWASTLKLSHTRVYAKEDDDHDDDGEEKKFINSGHEMHA
jgi:hypothetical protein